MKKTILSAVITVALVVVIAVEFIVGFNVLGDKILSDNEFYSEFAAGYGAANVTIDDIYEYTEAPSPIETGDVIALTEYGINVRVNGKITDSSFVPYGYIAYSYGEEATPTRLTFNKITAKLDEWNAAYNAYMKGSPESLLSCYGIRTEDATNTYYQQSTRDGRTAVIYNAQSDLYYEFVKLENAYIVLSSSQPFGLTKDPGTANFGDPTKNPMFTHSYSFYEVVAAANTRRNELEKDEEETESPYVQGGVIGTSDTYTSTSDNNKRRQMVSYSNYKWNKDGTAEGTTMIIDVTSAEAKKSEWVLTETEYGYSTAGLSIYGLSGSRNSSNMSISGTIANSVNAERPYVLVVKFINEAGELLAVKVSDNRDTPLGSASTSTGVQTFTAQITTEDCDVQAVTAIQFEAY